MSSKQIMTHSLVVQQCGDKLSQQHGTRLYLNPLVDSISRYDHRFTLTGWETFWRMLLMF